VAGFTTGEGSFFIKIYPSKTKLGEAVLLQFQLVQHIRDESLIRSISAYLDCGRVTVLTDAVYLHVTKFSDLTDKIIPIFQKYPILGVKAQDYKDFCEVANIMKEKGHLTIEGLNQIKKNKSRYEQRKIIAYSYVKVLFICRINIKINNLYFYSKPPCSYLTEKILY
jgi:hypothetical protein